MAILNWEVYRTSHFIRTGVSISVCSSVSPSGKQAFSSNVLEPTLEDSVPQVLVALRIGTVGSQNNGSCPALT